MDRRNFLAIIPSLSAIPFIGKDIVREKDKIILFDPTPKIIPSIPPTWDMRNLKAKLYLDDTPIADAYVTVFEAMPAFAFERDLETDRRIPLPMEYRFECVVNGPLAARFAY